MKVSYYAIFQYDGEDDDYAIEISYPDLPGCVSCAYSNSQAIEFSKEVLDLYLDSTELIKLPEPSPLSSLNLEENQKAVWITIDMKVENGILYGYNVIRL